MRTNFRGTRPRQQSSVSSIIDGVPVSGGGTSDMGPDPIAGKERGVTVK
jgi:hypothetical protein